MRNPFHRQGMPVSNNNTSIRQPHDDAAISSALSPVIISVPTAESSPRMIVNRKLSFENEFLSKEDEDDSNTEIRTPVSNVISSSVILPSVPSSSLIDDSMAPPMPPQPHVFDTTSPAATTVLSSSTLSLSLNAHDLSASLKFWHDIESSRMDSPFPPISPHEADSKVQSHTLLEGDDVVTANSMMMMMRATSPAESMTTNKQVLSDELVPPVTTMTTSPVSSTNTTSTNPQSSNNGHDPAANLDSTTTKDRTIVHEVQQPCLDSITILSSSKERGSSNHDEVMEKAWSTTAPMHNWGKSKMVFTMLAVLILSGGKVLFWTGWNIRIAVLHDNQHQHHHPYHDNETSSLESNAAAVTPPAIPTRLDGSSTPTMFAFDSKPPGQLAYDDMFPALSDFENHVGCGNDFNTEGEFSFCGEHDNDTYFWESTALSQTRWFGVNEWVITATMVVVGILFWRTANNGKVKMSRSSISPCVIETTTITTKTTTTTTTIVTTTPFKNGASSPAASDLKSFSSEESNTGTAPTMAADPAATSNETMSDVQSSFRTPCKTASQNRARNGPSLSTPLVRMTTDDGIVAIPSPMPMKLSQMLRLLDSIKPILSRKGRKMRLANEDDHNNMIGSPFSSPLGSTTNSCYEALTVQDMKLILQYLDPAGYTNKALLWSPTPQKRNGSTPNSNSCLAKKDYIRTLIYVYEAHLQHYDKQQLAKLLQLQGVSASSYQLSKQDMIDLAIEAGF